MTRGTERANRSVSPIRASVLVFSSSAAVLVIEILAGRLLAPYAGVTLETFTAIIGTILAGIAIGAWIGGRLADRIDPHRLLGPALALGGVSAMLTVPLVRLFSPAVTAGPVGLVMVVGVSALPPAAVLSSITPITVKALLDDLSAAGAIVGRISAIGTAGALFGTFVTGFVLVARLPTTTIVVSLGALLVTWGAVDWLRSGSGSAPVVSAAILVALAGAILSVSAADRCEVETAYYCVRVEVDANRPTGRILRLDTLRHSYVDLDDATYLEFEYVRIFAAAIDAHVSGSVRALHLGGGGLTMPRWLDATRPDSHSVVLELDPGLVDIAEERLGFTPSARIEIAVGDARTTLNSLEPAGFDVVIVDVFGGIAVPWHLTTAEMVDQLSGMLGNDGIYVANVIDRGSMSFARAELATLEQAFPNVAAVGPEGNLSEGGNIVLVASHTPLDLERLAELADERGVAVDVVGPRSIDHYIGDASVLTDDFAPVDQLLGRRGTSPSIDS